MKTIAVDFDGVIHGYSKGWRNGDIYDDPKPGCREGMQRLLDLGFEVVIYSTRCYDHTFSGRFEPNQVSEMIAYLSFHEIPYTRIHVAEGKPLCVLFIDDNAYRFVGDWNVEMPSIVSLVEKHIKNPIKVGEYVSDPLYEETKYKEVSINDIL